jgi:hypothetical protein
VDELSNLPADRPCPIGFIVMPAFVSALVWLYALLGSMAP